MSTPLPTTVADHALLAAIRAVDDTTALQHIAAARAEATVSIAHLYTEIQAKLQAEQARSSRLKVALEQQVKAAKEALST